tara:strand:+ start:2005 stop:3654 length:1650 start_codon:yes stop_codon:yes gene_type:complete
MLQQLKISNYALIENLSVDFKKGFTIITGETGAGKSVIVGAINLLLGARSSVDLLLDKNKKSIIEGLFKSNRIINEKLKDIDLDFGDDLIIRKEIKANGSSRSFINDTPVKVENLKDITQYLIEFNGQHLVSKIGKNSFKFDFVNGFVKEKNLINDYKKSFLNYTLFNERLSKLIDESSILNEKKDFFSFQLEELSDFPIEQWNEENIYREHNLITNQKYINQYLEEISNLFNNNSNGILNNLNKIDDNLNSLNIHLKDLYPFIERLKSIRIEIEDIFYDFNKKYSLQSENPKKLEELEQLINKINFLLKKFNVLDLNGLLKKRDTIVESLNQIKSLENQITECQKSKLYWENKCINLGEELFKKRTEKIDIIQKQVNKVLKSVSMEHANFKLKIFKTGNIAFNGIDQIELLVAVNNKLDYHPITKFSSGGELSRIALAMKSISVGSKSASVLIFDEIDSGISGKVATKVGLLLKSISKNVQVINITHLPQVAAFGNSHFHVEKNQSGSQINVNLRLLEKEDRIQVLANMLGGDKTGNAARNNALELLN